MISLIRFKTGVVILAATALLMGCRTEWTYSPADTAGDAATPDLDAKISLATEHNLPILVLVVESENSQADDRARKVFEPLSSTSEVADIVPVEFVPILIDLSVSRNRALAARFHVTDTPLLLGLSPHGLIMTRDQYSLTHELLQSRIADIVQNAPALDAKLGVLEDAAAKNANDVAAQMALANFLLAQQNDREAIPHLEVVAHNEATATTLRIQAWVDLVRAHFWIGEAEKGRHEANDLIAALGPDHPEARAGGNLALGAQDANTKRFARARQELEAAVAAAPESDYAKQASAALVKLLGGEK